MAWQPPADFASSCDALHVIVEGGGGGEVDAALNALAATPSLQLSAEPVMQEVTPAALDGLRRPARRTKLEGRPTCRRRGRSIRSRRAAQSRCGPPMSTPTPSPPRAPTRHRSPTAASPRSRCRRRGAQHPRRRARARSSMATDGSRASRPSSSTRAPTRPARATRLRARSPRALSSNARERSRRARPRSPPRRWRRRSALPCAGRRAGAGRRGRGEEVGRAE